MTVAELCAAQGCTVVVDAVTGPGPHPVEDDGVTVVDHLDEAAEHDHVGVVVDAYPADLDAAVGTADVRPSAVVVVLVRGAVADVDPDRVADIAARHDRVLARAVAFGHASTSLALVLVADVEEVDGDAVPSLHRLVTADLRQRLAARGDATAVTDELSRRGARIEGLRREADGLRARLDGSRRRHEAELRSRDRTIASLRREVARLRGSASYRIGHALVLLVKDPRRIARVPGQLVRLLRARLGR